MKTSAKSILEAYNANNTGFMGAENEEVAKTIFHKLYWSDNQEATANEIAAFLHGVDTYKGMLYGEDAIALFHVGRGSIYNIPGFLEYKGIDTINNIMDRLFLNEEGEFYAENGKLVGLTEEDAKTGIGRVDFDGEFDSWYSKKMIDLDNEEFLCVLEAEEDSAAKVAILMAHGMDKQEAMCEIITYELY